MKKTDYNHYTKFAANVADGLEFDEAQKLHKSSTRMRKLEQSRDKLRFQEAEWYGSRTDLLKTFEQVPAQLSQNASTVKQRAKADLLQVLTASR